MNPVPKITEGQRMDALRKTAAVRRERADLLRRLKVGETSLSDALSDPSAERIKVETLLRSLPGVGVAKAMRLMRDLGIAPSRRVRGLGRRQREALLVEVCNG